jgi:hypothetical protein
VEGNGKNAESSALGDFDGDGNIDAVGAHGFSDLSAFEGSAPGVHVVWGPEQDRVTDSNAWTDAGWVPATVGVGHPHWVTAEDVNGDGLTDIAVGGRQQGGAGSYEAPDSPDGNGTFTGLGWLEAPADPARRRNLDEWQFRRIDADEFSGHGFVFADLDGDGDNDIVDANADFDTPQDREEVEWYENPGNGTEAQRGEWKRTTLLGSPDFYAKPSVAVGDLDGDGRPDIATQTDSELIFFRNNGSPGAQFETIKIPKPPAIAWRSRAVRLADVDGDDDLDVIGMLIHDSNELPPDKASVYLLLNNGSPWQAAGWDLQPIKWGPGPSMLVPGFGEKWDQVDVTDVDGDGDLDVVANNEEWWAEARGEVAPFFTPDLATSAVAVVWFENRLGDPPYRYGERNGVVDMEAERPTLIGDSTWVERAPVTGDRTAAPALQVLNGLSLEDVVIPAASTKGVEYGFDAEGGDYTLWARVFQPERFGNNMGADRSDSLWAVVDGGSPMVVGDDPAGASDQWVWVRVPGSVPLTAGQHSLALRARERGVAVDRVVLARDPAYSPA